MKAHFLNHSPTHAHVHVQHVHVEDLTGCRMPRVPGCRPSREKAHANHDANAKPRGEGRGEGDRGLRWRGLVFHLSSRNARLLSPRCEVGREQREAWAESFHPPQNATPPTSLRSISSACLGAVSGTSCRPPFTVRKVKLCSSVARETRSPLDTLQSTWPNGNGQGSGRCGGNN